MFFVIYVIDARTHIVIPIKWVKDCDIIVQKAMNYSLNSNQIHRCYYSTNINQNGETTQVADFTKPLNDALPVNGDCCFLGKMKKYFRKKNIHPLCS